MSLDEHKTGRLYALLSIVLILLYGVVNKDSPIALTILALLHVTLTSIWSIPAFKLKGVCFAIDGLVTLRLRLKEFKFLSPKRNLLESLALVAGNERRVAYDIA